jgi:hypothetical protein
VKRLERHEVDARPIEAKPKPIQSDEESCHDDEPAVIGQQRRLPTNDRAIMHGRIFDCSAAPTLAVFGRDPPTESEYS